MVTKAKTKDPIIDAEEMISEITDELKKVEKASKQLEKANTKSESLIEMTEEVVKQSKALQAKGNEIFTELEDLDFPSKFDKLDKRIGDHDKQIIENVSKQLEKANTRSESLIEMTEEVVEQSKAIQANFPSRFDKLTKRIGNIDKQMLKNHDKSFKKIKVLESDIKNVGTELGSDIKTVGAELNKNLFEIKGGLISKIEGNEKRIIDGQNKSFKKLEDLLLKKQKRDMLLYLTIIGLLIILLITNIAL